ncbi:MAG TPA: cytochrome c [Bacteroidales bacterium]|nr:cytochrome c [Bacteroidales bacterium]
MRRIFILAVLIVPLSLAFGCKGTTGEKEVANKQDSSVMEQGTIATGQNEYVKYCLTCHQPDGNGVRSQFPPLAGNVLVTGPADTLIRIVLSGLEGPITVMGQQYGTQIMPAQNYLTDQQIADVLSYIRNTWGNKADAVNAEEVKKIRGER